MESMTPLRVVVLAVMLVPLIVMAKGDVAAVKPVPRTIFGVALAVTPVVAVLRLIAAAIAMALAARVEETDVVSEAVSSVDNAWVMDTPLIIIDALSSSPVEVIAGAVVVGIVLKYEVINAVSDL